MLRPSVSRSDSLRVELPSGAPRPDFYYRLQLLVALAMPMSQIRYPSNVEGQVPVYISSRNRVAQLCLQVLGSLFVASYDSQGYGGGIRTILHAGIKD
jgi:hypothetical protein